MPTIYVLSRNKKNISVFIRKLSVFGGEIFNIFEWACLRHSTGKETVQRTEIPEFTQHK